MKLKIKKGVVANISVEFAVILGAVKQMWESSGLGEFVVTSLKDGTHKKGSDHKQDEPDSLPGEAADIRTHAHFDKATGKHSNELLDFARRLQLRGLKVVVHPDQVKGVNHLHVARKVELFERVG